MDCEQLYEQMQALYYALSCVMAFDRKIGHTILHAVWYSRSRLMLHHIFNTEVCCNVFTYKAVLGYKRVCHTNQSTWLQGHKSANQLRSHWRARLHGKHSFPLSLPPPRHFFFFFFLCASLAIMKPFEGGSKSRCTYLPTAQRARRTGGVKVRRFE